MQWIIENWVLLIVGGGMVGMHLFGHGHGHGQKGGHDTTDHGTSKNVAKPDPIKIEPSREDTNA